MSAPRVTLVPIEEPYDDMERQLLERIHELRRGYEEAAKPYVDALVRSRMMKPTRTYMQVEMLTGEGTPRA